MKKSGCRTSEIKIDGNCKKLTGNLTEEQKTAFSFAIQDIKNGHETLWTNRLKKEYPELYKYAVEQREKHG